MDLLVWELLVPIVIEDEPATPVNKKRDPVWISWCGNCWIRTSDPLLVRQVL